MSQNGITGLNSATLAQSNSDRLDEMDELWNKAGGLGLNDDQKFSSRDEDYDVDFNDTRKFAVLRWEDLLKGMAEKLTNEDRQVITRFREWQTLTAEIQSKVTDSVASPAMKREMSKIHQLPRNLGFLAKEFMNLVKPNNISFELLWGLIYLNLRHSYSSLDRLKRTTETLSRLRNVVARFNKIVPMLDDANEALLAVVDFLDPCITILVDSVIYLHKCSVDAKAERDWPDLNSNINVQLLNLNETVKHVSDMNIYTKATQDRNIRNLSMRHAMIPEVEEAGAFPILSLQQKQNPRFFGRQDELESIERYLTPSRTQDSLRSYTLHGKRGVGKTEVAVQFAYTNRCNFDAIFWVQCETSISIRESFSEMAMKLELPGADREGHHEENLLAVQNWLKRTKKIWLLIFDNAEKDQVLQKYWPVGASGAILITTRKYYNFVKDLRRKGETIKPLDPKQSWDLLLHLLGEEWEKQEQEGRLPQSEMAAARLMLEKLEGLALAIQQAANLIKNPNIGGPTIAKTYESFKEKSRILPDRHSKPRTSSERALDALWDMNFNSLGINARALLGVLAWLSPDSILVDLFLPRNQAALYGSLEFCRQDSIHLDSKNRASLVNTITPSGGFMKAVKELTDKSLIKYEGRYLSIHRMVQEAVNFHDEDDLKDCFDMASRLVYEQFPKQDTDESLYKKWSICASYIHHGIYLGKKVSEEYAGSDIIRGSSFFVKLLSNCAWYLYEVGDCEGSRRLVDTAIMACEDKTTLQYAQLRDIEGSCFFDLNRLSECRDSWEAVLRIRMERLPSDHARVGTIHNNLGNLETASGDFAVAEEHYKRASLIWQNGQDETAYQLALTYLCLGRMHILQRELDEADRIVARAEILFIRLLGGDKGLMSHVHLCQGKIHFLRGRQHWSLARRSYDSCLAIGLQEFPIHPLTGAAYYAIACLEFAQGHADAAKIWLDKSLSIAQLLSPTRDDGVITRILWKTSQVLESATLGEYDGEAAALKERAVGAREVLLASGEGGFISSAINSDDACYDEDELGFDALVPLFFR
ncbi:hypothetical protein B0O99DRAFT_587847 [Bisporella sp. PMI_857]|nr:hypothetical protein B0O99DRAFT_587847 [Bisporella sp. PMI_857]